MHNGNTGRHACDVAVGLERRATLHDEFDPPRQHALRVDLVGQQQDRRLVCESALDIGGRVGPHSFPELLDTGRDLASEYAALPRFVHPRLALRV